MSTPLVTANRFRTGITLANARAVLREPRHRRLFFWWVLAWLALALCAVMRGYMDDLGLSVHGASTEEKLFGSLPSLWLQDHVYPLAPGVFAWAVRVIHGSWFIVPWLVGLLVTWKKPERIGSFFTWWIGLHFIVNPMFGLFPLQPPWMADSDVVRIVALHTAKEIPDNNPLAAMPSLHVALPLLISYWLLRERWKLPALAMLAYAAVVASEVVFAGEHYVIDVLGAVVVVAAIALVMQLDYRRTLARLTMPLRRLERRPAAGSALHLQSGAGSGGGLSALTSRPEAILAVTAALIVVVSVQAVLALSS
jgi:membrane-associated phospholipid phosphatase